VDPDRTNGSISQWFKAHATGVARAVTLAAYAVLLIKWPGAAFTILILSLIILIHEYGHYRAMKSNGIIVPEFTIGVGRTLWSWKLKSGTEFKIKPVLLGGYTKPVAAGPGSMAAASHWVRFKVLMAGMFFNTLSACVALIAIIYITGGMMPANLHPLARTLDEFLPAWLVPLAVGVVGPFRVWLLMPYDIVSLLVTSFQSFQSGVAGPIGIIQYGASVAANAPSFGEMALHYLFFFYGISTAIAGCNLLPVSFLDGGQIIALGLDKIGGRHGPRLANAFLFLTLPLFLALVFLCFKADILRLIAGKAIGQ